MKTRVELEKEGGIGGEGGKGAKETKDVINQMQSVGPFGSLLKYTDCKHYVGEIWLWTGS